jgi:hypothetical protein
MRGGGRNRLPNLMKNDKDNRQNIKIHIINKLFNPFEREKQLRNAIVS